MATSAMASPSVPLTLESMKQSVDMLWLVAAGALVFFMQAGFAFLESGMARSKNTVNVIMKNYCDMCFGAVAFWLVGYGLMFGANPSGWLGTTAFALHHVPEAEYGMLFFQTMFAATAATIVSGAVAERTRFSAYIIGSVVITGVIYPVFGAWAWGSVYGGTGWLREMGFIDFAGSSVVHAVGGWAALAALLCVGPRLGRFGPDGRPRQILGHNLTLVALGAFILWIGWFGFNAGSTASASVSLGRIALNTHLGGAAGALGAMAVLVLGRQRVLMTSTINGSIAGLVGVTAGCHVMEPAFALLTGAVAGGLSVVAAQVLDALRIDDVVGAVSVHVVGGVWGTLAAGLFKAGDLFNPHQLGVQALGCLVAFAWAFGGSMLMYRVINLFVPLRASTLDEQRGLDFTEHYELGYPEFQQDAVHRGK
ncbi:ammonium transporter [Aquabacterium lacunae]|uniref:Ammonium transporter n=1 Tax=Aquabacterium lacunae TaxID=2528630 RepID=A0A4Q9H0Y9_9BURK|nr:ammonium transporter [Aquabacterium lacunae]TBO32798.1 ammonium transporter [Aquabacterium lacunae]